MCWISLKKRVRRVARLLEYSEKKYKIENDEESPKVEKTQYQKLGGKYIYLSHTTTDLAYAVSMVSKFIHDPWQHFQVVNRIIQKVTPSGEAKFRVVSQGVRELLWIKIVLNDLKYVALMKLFCDTDNKFDIIIAHNLVQHERTKHIEVDRHFFKEKLDSGFTDTGVCSFKTPPPVSRRIHQKTSYRVVSRSYLQAKNDWYSFSNLRGVLYSIIIVINMINELYIFSFI